ncbi:MAG: DUF2116 family Zn-ribbon domain-containing protein [Candidatus Hadarchaeales archaeon]
MEDHRHCIICGKAIPTDKYVCSPSCETILKSHQKQAQRMRMITLAVFFLFFIILVMTAILRSSG